MATPDLGALNLSDSDPEELFASPSTRGARPAGKPQFETQDARPVGGSKYDAEQARDDDLRRELESVRSVNEVIEGVLSSLEVAKGNMEVCTRPGPASHVHWTPTR